MSIFDTVKLQLCNMLDPYRGTRSVKDFEAMISHLMRYHAKLYKSHKRKSMYDFDATDIEIIYHRILSDLKPR